MARNSILSELQLLKVLPISQKGGTLLVQINKDNTLNNFIFLKRNITILNQLGHLTVIDQFKLLTAISTTISLQVASSGCQNTSQPYITCATTLKIASILICYQGRSLSLPLLVIKSFLSSQYSVTIQKIEKHSEVWEHFKA